MERTFDQLQDDFNRGQYSPEARLRDAAPDLLAALKEAREVVARLDFNTHSGTLWQIDQAIAKAEGQQ